MNQGQHFTLVGWVVFLLILYLLSKTNEGYRVIYYMLVLVLVFLLVNHYKQVTAAMVTGG